MSKPLDPEGSFEQLKDGVVKSIQGYFPNGEFKGKVQTLRLKRIEADDTLDFDDHVAQQQVKEKDGTWSVPVKAEFELVDNATGKVVDNKTMTLTQLPKFTPRFSYIIDGQERQVDHQSVLKQGIFTRVADNGILESRFSTKSPDGRVSQFQTKFDPQSYKYEMKVGETNVPLYPVLKALGVSDESMKSSWGKEVWASNAQLDDDKALKKLYKRMYHKDPPEGTDVEASLRSVFHGLELNPEVTKMTVGKEHSTVTGESLLDATSTLIQINKGDKKPSGYDDLRFKNIRHTEDYIPERITESSRQIVPKILNNLDRADKIDRIVTRELFSKPVKSFFTNSALSVLGDQTNPLGMLTGHSKHTIMGEHGISSAHQVTEDAKVIDPSTYGFFDPVHTPESDRTGVSLQIPLGTWKEGNDLVTSAINAKTGRTEKVTATRLASSNLGFPDEFKFEAGKKPVARTEQVTVADRNGETSKVNASEVDYIIPSHANLFSATSNLIPFLQSNNGNRVGYGTQQAHQALGLKYREEPLVQSSLPTGRKTIGGEDTFEGAIGQATGHRAKVTGTVTKVDNEYIHIKGDDGKEVKHALYNYYPLNNKKTMYHSEPLVQVGDKVEAGKAIADTNYTKNGRLAMGTNLAVGYIPAKGYNFEDGIVISESASQKLTSEHLYKKELQVHKNVRIGKNKYLAHAQTEFDKEQLKNVGDDGVVQLGTRVKPGDPLVLSVIKNEVGSEAEGLARVSKGLVDDWRKNDIRWEGDTEGTVVKVVRHGDKIKVHVTADEPMQVGDKLVGRHGNKGIVTKIVPDQEMPEFTDPVTGEKSNLQVMLNPMGVPGRINTGQLFETSAGLIARKTGQPFKVLNFNPDIQDYNEYMENELKKHGLRAKTEVRDPATGKVIGDIHLGNQYMMKLDQQVSKKMSARGAGFGNPYDANRAPTTGGGRLGALGNYALLAHGATHNLREMQTFKSSMNDDAWRAIQTGSAMPAPRPSYAYEKFESLLKGMGVNINKEGNQLILEPLTDKQLTEMSSGEVKDPGRMLYGKNLKAEKGGLFDPKVFGKDEGGLRGTRWGHITLDTPMPNPVFEKAITTLIDVKGKDFQKIIAGEQELNGKTGPKAIQAALSNIDVKAELAKLEAGVKTAPVSQLDKMNKKIRYLRNLNRLGMSPNEAYMRTKVPVLPPIMRPLSALPDGSINSDDINSLYRGLGLVNGKLKDMDKDLKELPEEAGKLHGGLYDAMKALSGVGTVPDFHYSTRDKLKSIMSKIEGSQPKEGFFQKTVMSRKQDMSMRSTIIPSQKIKLDEVGIPKAGALQMFKPHIVRELRNLGLTTGQANVAITKNDRIVDKALEKVMKDTPVLLKRDPVLHKFGVMAFKPKLSEGMAIEIHPLVTGGFNADFDGDTMAAFAPATKDAIEEAKKMLPSNHLFNPTYGSTMYTPGHEAQVGIYQLSRIGAETKHSFPTEAAAAAAMAKGDIKFDDQIKIGAQNTTMGRVMLDHTLPEGMRGSIKNNTSLLNKKVLGNLLETAAKEHKSEYADMVHALKDLGNETATQTGMTISLEDIRANKELRQKVFGPLQVQEQKIRADKKLTKSQKDAQIVELYQSKLKTFDDLSRQDLRERGSALALMMDSGGASGSKWSAFKQLAGAPIMFEDAKGDPVPVPVLKSYGEGLSIAEYLTAAHGARMGTLSKSQGTSKPGALSKNIVNSTMNLLIAGEDCGTTKGVFLDVNDTDIVDRYLASDVQLSRGRTLKAGTLITPAVKDSLRNNGKSKIHVRSPMKCAHGDGICQLCAGVSDDGRNWDKGTNFGIISAQALGEPSTQMAMNAFHTGGILAVGDKTVKGQAFSNLTDLLNVRSTIKGSAKLSPATGTIQAVRKDPAGGFRVAINSGSQTHDVWVPQLQQGYKQGAKVKAGDALSPGLVNPAELLPLAGLDAVKNSLTNQIHDTYGGGIRRRHVETVVKSITDLGVVKNPGDNTEVLPGDLMSSSRIKMMNEKLPPGKTPITFQPILKGVEQLPTAMQEDWAARLNYRRLKNTLIEGALEGWQSDIHGRHPVPGMMYGAEFGVPKGSKGPY